MYLPRIQFTSIGRFVVLCLGLWSMEMSAQNATLTIDPSNAQFWVHDPVISVAFDLVSYSFGDRSITGSLNCLGNGPCSGSFPIGSTVTLDFSAPGAAAKGIGFIGWGGPFQTCVGLGPCSFVITQDTELSYSFILPPIPPNVLGITPSSLSTVSPSVIATDTDVTITASAVGIGGHLTIFGLTNPSESTFQATSDTTGIYTVRISRDRLSQFTTPVVLAVFADTCDDSCFTNVIPLSIMPNNCLSGHQPGAGAALFDPVPDLLAPAGSSITSDMAALLKQDSGRPVIGVAADGVAQLVIRIPACKLGENVTVTVLNDSKNPSSSSDTDGGVATPGQTSLTAYEPSVSVTATGTDSQPMGIITYRAPVDFSREGNQSDIDSAVRSVFLQINLDSLPNQPIIQEIKVMRPPVALIHGLWSSADAWRHFLPGIKEAHFSVMPLDYSSNNAGRVQQNASFLLPQIRDLICKFAKAKNIASVQVDIVAHSMGGLITRQFVKTEGFVDGQNYAAGYVHKLITIDTPHTGTPLANRLIASNIDCHLLFDLIAHDPIDKGAIRDLSTNSLLLKDLLSGQRLDHGIPTHAIVAIASESQESATETNWLLEAISNVCNLLPSDKFSLLFNGPSDLVVGQSSQAGEGVGIFNSSLISTQKDGFIHSEDKYLFKFGPDVLSSKEILDVVLALLDIPVNEKTFSVVTPTF